MAVLWQPVANLSQSVASLLQSVASLSQSVEIGAGLAELRARTASTARYGALTNLNARWSRGPIAKTPLRGEPFLGRQTPQGSEVELTPAPNVTPLKPRRLFQAQGKNSGNDPTRQVRVDPVAVARDLAELVTRENRRAADERQRRERAEATASDLVVMVAHEHRRASEEEKRRKKAEATASDLAVLVAHEHAALEDEREARRRAEAAASRLTELLAAERGGVDQIVVKRARFARRG